MDKIKIANSEFDAYKIPTTKGTLLLIKGSKGILGCAYLNVEIAEKINEALAIVTGVKSYDDMLEAKIIAVSNAAKELGVDIGMSGQEALELMK